MAGWKRSLPYWLTLSMLLVVLVMPLARWASVVSSPARQERQTTPEQSVLATFDADGDGLPDFAPVPVFTLALIALVCIFHLLDDGPLPLGRHVAPAHLPPR